MPSSQEPDQYSLDEMMDRLQRRSADPDGEAGELVTRADGTTAVRVRKRKRRTLQPHKEQLAKVRRMRIIQASMVMLLLLLFGVVAGGALIFGNSPVFRTRLVNGIAAKTGSTPDLREFRINPKTANANTIQMNWPEGNVIRDLFIRTIYAEIHPISFLGESLTGEEIRFGQGEVHLDVPQPTQPRSSESVKEPLMDLRFKRYTCAKTRMWAGPKEAPLLRLEEAEAILQTLGGKNRPHLLMSRGTLNIPRLLTYRINRGHIEFRGDDLHLIGLRLLHETDNIGEFKLSGVAHPYDASKISTLAVELSEFSFEGLVGQRLGKTFAGRVDTTDVARSNFFAFTPSHQPAAVLAVSFQSSLATPFQIQGFPAFQLLAKVLDDKWYESPIFESDVTGSLRREKGELVLADLQCENRSRIFLKSDLIMAANLQITGSMQIGIPDGLIKASRNRRLDQVFTKESDGYRWVDLKISGRADAPQDNLAALYDAASNTPVNPELGVPGFEELTRPD